MGIYEDVCVYVYIECTTMCLHVTYVCVDSCMPTVFVWAWICTCECVSNMIHLAFANGIYLTMHAAGLADSNRGQVISVCVFGVLEQPSFIQTSNKAAINRKDGSSKTTESSFGQFAVWYQLDIGFWFLCDGCVRNVDCAHVNPFLFQFQWSGQ